MKTVVLMCTSLLILSASTCKKEGDNCHHNIVVKNNSNKVVIFALRGYYDSLCFLSKQKNLAPNEEATLNLRYCWEDELSNGRAQEIYLIDTSFFNSQNEYYNCDSIEYKNTILKHYTLKVDDLKKNNFIVTYP